MTIFKYFETMRDRHNELSQWYDTLADLYRRKLWFQLTHALDEFLVSSAFQVSLNTEDPVLELYRNYFDDLKQKKNLFKLANFRSKTIDASTIRQEYAEFYRSALLFLSSESVESLVKPIKQDLGFDLALSALLGDNIYNFGELLVHPIIKLLLGSEAEWIYYILEAFNAGDIDRYQVLCSVHSTALNSQPDLVQNETKLLEKINILCLMKIIFSWSSEDRTIPLSIIAEQTKLSVEDVKCLLEKCLSVHLIDGMIDQVKGTVYVSWVQPGVFGTESLHKRSDNIEP